MQKVMGFLLTCGLLSCASRGKPPEIESGREMPYTQAYKQPVDKSDHLFVVVGDAWDLSKRLPEAGNDTISKHVAQTLKKHSSQTFTLISEAEFEAAKTPRPGYKVTPSLASIKQVLRAGYTEIHCDVVLHVQTLPKPGAADTMNAENGATAQGSGAVTTETNSISPAITECAVAVSEEVTARQIVPFLRKKAHSPEFAQLFVP